MSARVRKHRNEPVSELMMRLPTRMHIRAVESLLGLNVFGSICPTAGFVLQDLSSQSLQTPISTWRKELSQKAGYRLTLLWSHHQSGEVIKEFTQWYEWGAFSELTGHFSYGQNWRIQAFWPVVTSFILIDDIWFTGSRAWLRRQGQKGTLEIRNEESF